MWSTNLYIPIPDISMWKNEKIAQGNVFGAFISPTVMSVLTKDKACGEKVVNYKTVEFVNWLMGKIKNPMSANTDFAKKKQKSIYRLS